MLDCIAHPWHSRCATAEISNHTQEDRAMTRMFAGMICATLLSGCISVPPSSKIAGESNWQGKTVAVTTRARADFVAMTAGKATFAMIGALAMIEAGKGIVKDNGIEDPVPHLAKDLQDAAIAKYGALPYSGPAINVSTDKIPELAKAGAAADVLLDVQSTGYDFRYLPLDWSHYVVDSQYIVRVIDTKSGKIIGAGRCMQSTKDEKPLPTRNELLDNKAEKLKSFLTAQRDACLKQLTNSLFGAE